METFLVLNLLHYVFALTNKLLSQHLLNMLRLQLTSTKMVGFVFRCRGYLDSQIRYHNNYFRAEEQMRKRENELAKNGKLDEHNQEITNLVE